MSATSGMRIWRLISPSFSAASRTGTAQRTMSQPDASSDQISSRVACTSRVSVLVIDCTVIGAPPPTLTLPTCSCLLFRRLIISLPWDGAPSQGSPLPLLLPEKFEGVDAHEVVVERVDHQRHQQHEPHALGGLTLLQRQWSPEN